MGHNELVALAEKIAGLDRADALLISVLLGTDLVANGLPTRWAEYRAASATRAFAEASARIDATSGFGLLRLVPHAPAPTRDALGIGEFPTYGDIDLNPNIPPEGQTTYIRSRRATVLVGIAPQDVRIEVRYGFLSRSDTLREIVISWASPRIAPGEEPVFHAAPPLIYLPSYDSVHEVLEYSCATRAWRILPRAEFVALGRAEAFGAFARGVPAKSGAGELMGAVFSTPEGPAVVAGSKRALVYPHKTEARIDALPERRRRFSLSKSGSHELELIYAERHGVGTNPYDLEEADVDLFALIQRGLKDERWLAAYKRPWA